MEIEHAAQFFVVYLTSDQDPAIENPMTEKIASVSKNESYCKHYNRSSCLFKYKCCQDSFFPCHKCHNEHNAAAPCQEESEEGEENEDNVTPHDEHPTVMSKDAIAYKCTQCLKVSKIDEFSDKCIECNTKYALYVCVKCKQVVNDKKLDPYHCDGCGTCRVDKSNSFHCPDCNLCYHNNLRNHKCLQDSGQDECGVCLEEVFTGCLVLPCSHKIHRDCFKLLIEHKRINCPICRQCFVSLADLEQQPSYWKRLKSFLCGSSKITSRTQVQNI